MSEHDPALREAWHRFCDELKAAGEVAFRPTAANGSVDRAAGVRDARMERVSGKADRSPVADDPADPRNRRVEITLLRRF